MVPDFKTALTDPRAETPSAEALDALIARYEWFVPLRILRERATGKPDARLAVTAPWRAESSLRAAKIDTSVLTVVSPDERIDRFLREEDLRIVAAEEGPDEEVRLAPELEEEDCVVSEELAAIYLAQGLSDKAAAIYRKLSLLNPEKSIYFAELIAKTEKNN